MAEEQKNIVGSALRAQCAVLTLHQLRRDLVDEYTENPYSVDAIRTRFAIGVADDCIKMLALQHGMRDDRQLSRTAQLAIDTITQITENKK